MDFKHNYGSGHVIHILDDFFIAESSKLACLGNFSTLLKVFVSLRVPIVAAKTLTPPKSWNLWGLCSIAPAWKLGSWKTS